MRAAQQAEHPRPAHQVAPGHSPWRLPQPVRPFQAGALHPARRATLQAGEEVDRRADAQRQPTGDAARFEPVRDGLLLRRTEGQQAEAERAVRFDEVQAGFHGHGVVDEAHRRIDVRQPAQAVALAQLLRLCVAAADQHQCIVGHDHVGEEFLRQVAAGAHRQPHAVRRPHHVGQEAAVQQHETRRRVVVAKSRIVFQADQVIGIRRHDEAVFVLSESGGLIREGSRVVGIEGEPHAPGGSRCGDRGGFAASRAPSVRCDERQHCQRHDPARHHAWLGQSGRQAVPLRHRDH